MQFNRIAIIYFLGTGSYNSLKMQNLVPSSGPQLQHPHILAPDRDNVHD